jgi:hypothetical protein
MRSHLARQLAKRRPARGSSASLIPTNLGDLFAHTVVVNRPNEVPEWIAHLAGSRCGRRGQKKTCVIAHFDLSLEMPRDSGGGGRL